MRYIVNIIKSFEHKGLKKLFETGSHKGVRPDHAPRLLAQLDRLDNAAEVEDMNIAGWELHALKGDRAGKWSVKVNANWRLVFRMEDGHAYVVDYEDYH